MKNNLSDYIIHHAANNGDKIFCHEINGSKITYKDFNDKINQCCKFFKKLNLENQSLISVKLENSIKYLIIYFSCLRSNIIINPLPDSLSKNETIKNLKSINPDLYFGRENVFVSKNQICKCFEIKNYSEFIELLNQYDEADFNLISNVSDDTACIYYSSGTTGNPKCVEYTHGNMLSLIRSISLEFGFTKKEIFLGVLPVGHTAIINYQLLPCVLLGAKMILVKNFNSIRPDLWKIICDFKISNFQIVPTILFAMLSTPYAIEDVNKNKTLKYISCGSAPLSSNIQQKSKERFNIPVSNLYGLSETGPSHFDDPLSNDWIPGSIGYPLTVNECVILDENNNECPIGEVGQIGLKGKNVFKGYYNNVEATKNAFHNDFFLTGDIGYQNEDGKFFFSDRVKDLIIKGGVNIVPGEIEEVIYKIDDVLSVAIIGKEDRLFGEDLVAFIQKSSDSKIDANYIKTFLSDYFQPLKIPQDIRFINKMPIGPSGKILKKELRTINE